MSAPAHPKIEIDVTATLAHALLGDQQPDLADLPRHDRVLGWDNMLPGEVAAATPVGGRTT